MLTSATELEEKAVIIKSMANAGIPEFLPEFEKLILNPTEDFTVRGIATMYLSNYTSIAPKKVCSS